MPRTRIRAADISVKHVASLLVVTVALWLALSGYAKPLLLSLGAVSAVLTVWLAVRMEIIDHESYPVELSVKLLRYWLWLGKEIVKSNLDVARRILTPGQSISPTVTRVITGKRTNIGLAIYANSITLTPGTVAMNITDDGIEVHALTRAGAESLHEGAMARRIPDPGVEA